MSFCRMNLTKQIAWFGCLALIGLWITQGNIAAQAEGAGDLGLPIDIAADFTYSSLYYWRGGQAGEGSFAMPSIDISYGTESVTVGANLWYAQGFEEDSDESHNNSEIDYTLYAEATAGPVDVSIGVIDYTIPAGVPFNDTHVLEVTAGIGMNTLPFDNGVAVYVNVDGDDDNSIFIAPSIGYTYKDWALGLTLGIATGKSDYYSTDGAALLDITPSISYVIPFGDTEAAISLNVGYNPKTGTRMPFFTIGTGFSL